MVVVRGRGEGVGELLFSGSRVSLFQDEKSSGDAWWWRLHNNVSILNATELYSKKILKMVLFMPCVLYYNFLKYIFKN